MKAIKKRVAILLASVMVLSIMCVSSFAAEVVPYADGSGGGTSDTVISAFQSGFTSMAGDAMKLIAVIVPIAVGVAGVIWLSKKAMSWFKSMGQ